MGYLKKFYPPSIIQIIILFFIVAIADVFTLAHRYVNLLEIRPVTHFLFVILVILAFEFFVRPEDTWSLGITLAIIIGIYTIVPFVIRDLIIEYILSSRTPIMIISAIVAPFIAAYLYPLAKK